MFRRVSRMYSIYKSSDGSLWFTSMIQWCPSNLLSFCKAYFNLCRQYSIFALLWDDLIVNKQQNYWNCVIARPRLVYTTSINSYIREHNWFSTTSMQEAWQKLLYLHFLINIQIKEFISHHCKFPFVKGATHQWTILTMFISTSHENFPRIREQMEKKTTLSSSL